MQGVKKNNDTWESILAVLCVHNTAGLVSSSGWVHCVHCTVCTMCTLYSSVYIVHCTVCTLQILTAFFNLAQAKANILVFVLY